MKMATKFVTVRAPARLHLGFLDMHGGLDRKFGSLGVAIKGIETALVAEYADDIEITGPCAERASIYAEQLLSHFGINGGVRMQIETAIPEHAGLGSGTQLSLAVASAIAQLYQLDSEPQQLATILHRGARSGIGIGTFTYGGFIVDAGRGPETVVPPVISHMSMPEHWRILLVFDNASQGINGVPERRAFSTLPPLDAQAAGLLCRLTLMQALPAIAENDCKRFGEAITRIQTIIGDYFAQVQGGRFTSPYMADILGRMQAMGATGSGQSSWGPTGFAIFPNETKAFQALKQIREEWRNESRLQFMLTEARNQRASITETTTRPVLKADIEKVAETATKLGEL